MNDKGDMTMKATIKDGKLIIEIAVQDPMPTSGSGKSLVVASTYGNHETELEVAGKKVVIGLNAYVKR